MGNYTICVLAVVVISYGDSLRMTILFYNARLSRKETEAEKALHAYVHPQNYINSRGENLHTNEPRMLLVTWKLLIPPKCAEKRAH